MNHTHISGVISMDRNQLDNSVMISTWPRDVVYSPVPPTANGMGKKAKIVVKVDVNSGIASVRPAARAASRRSSPRCIRLRMSSAMTMPLSTSMPSAMISEAIDMR